MSALAACRREGPCAEEEASRRIAGRNAVPTAALYGQGNPAPGDPPASVPLHLGPVALAPTLTLTDFGWDSNVLNQHESDGPAQTILRRS